MSMSMKPGTVVARGRHAAWSCTRWIVLGVVIVLIGATGTSGQQFTKLPDLPDNVPQPAFDTGVGSGVSIPDLPTQVPPAAPETFNATDGVGCSTDVRAVLRQNGRTQMLQLLAQDAVGSVLLDGSVYATILAPTDGAMAKLPSLNTDPKVASTITQYHIINGAKKPVAGRGTAWWRTTLRDPNCRTAFSTVTVLPDPSPNAEAGGFLVKSAASTARVTATVQACNTVIHLLDNALQPCCTSLFEVLPQFSIVKLQPSYFDGFMPIAPPENDDGDNRRIFEDALVDLLLYMTPANITRTVLWPVQQAWDSLQLQSLMPRTNLKDLATRQAALKVLALYAQSYQDIVLPQDIPVNGSAPAMTQVFQPAMANITNGSVIWSCPDLLAVKAPKWVAPAVVQPPVVASPGAAADGNASAPANAPATAPANASAPANAPAPATPPATPRKAAGKRLLSAKKLEELLGGAAARKLQAASTGNSKQVGVVNVLDTCENIRIVLVDSVPVPCNFEDLISAFQTIEAQLVKVAPRVSGPTSLEAAMIQYMVKTGLASLIDTSLAGGPSLRLSSASGIPNIVSTPNGAAPRAGSHGSWTALAAALAAGAAVAL